MNIRRTVRVFIVAGLLFSGMQVSAQVDPAIIQKAKAMGLSQSEIDAAVAAQKAGGGNQKGILSQQQQGLLNKIAPRDMKDGNAVVRTEHPDSLFSRNRHLFDSIGLDYNMYQTLRLLSEANKNKKQSVFGKEIFTNENLTFAPSYSIATPSGYVLGAGDELIIDAWGASEMSARKVVTPEGFVVIEGVGPVSVNGLTIADAEKRIASKINQIMGGSQVKVSLGQIRSIKINIAGEVSAPGTYTLPSLATVFNAIYSAGGVNDIGSLRNIKVYRNSKEIASLDVYDYLINGKYETNVRLEDNDMIIVAPYDSYVSVNGKIKRDRIYEMKKGETLNKLIDYAGGFTGNAYTQSVNVNRKTGRQYSVQTVDADDFGSFVLFDGDSVSIGEIIPEYANRLQIGGAVWRPGEYELSGKLNSLSKLIEKAEGLKGNEFASRGQITRLKDDYTYEVVPFDVRKIVSGAEDITLQREDSIYIPSLMELREDYRIVVKGEVNKPDTLAYRDGMTVEDVILMSGGLKESASLAKVEIARRIKDPNSTEYSNKIADVYTMNITADLALSPADQRFVLHPFDEIYVRRSPAYSEQNSVSVVGEALFTGDYVLGTSGERISDVIKKAGGFTPEAYVRGASVRRRLTDDEKAKVTSLLNIAENNKGQDSLSLATVKIPDFYPLGVDIEKAMDNPGSVDDIILRNGDQIFIPKFNSMVRVSGAVFYPNTVVYDGSRVKPYVYQGGGYKDNARRRPFVIYMNGKVAATRNGFLSRRYPKVEPGCEVVVPMKPEKKGGGLAGVMGMMSSTASMAAMIASIINVTK